jgi:hypothetical protein
MAHLSPTTVFDVQTLAAYAIFLASYLVFALGKFPGLKIDRAGAAIIGAVGMVAFRIVHPADSLRFIDFPTLVLLFSMMLIVGNLHLVGFFEWTAEIVLRRLKPSHLLPAVIFTSGVLSAFFVNDIVCLVMVPFVLRRTTGAHVLAPESEPPVTRTEAIQVATSPVEFGKVSVGEAALPTQQWETRGLPRESTLELRFLSA